MLIAARNGFLVGKNSILPPGARWVEYLESTGTQWIDTGIVPTNHKTVLSFQVASSVSDFGYIAGSYNVNDNRYYPMVYNGEANVILTAANSILFSDNNNGQKHTVEYNGENGLCKFDGSSVGSLTKQTLAATNPLYLFAASTSSGPAQNSKCRIYGTEIVAKGTNTPVRDFRPIAIGTTGYMLDLVSGEYLQYGNKGTGDFVIGPDINAPAS